MIFLYNFLQFLLLLLFWPLLLVVVVGIKKYRGRILARLGFCLPERHPGAGGKRIWIHALSVGEVTSCRSLVAGLRQSMPESVILFSAATRAGEVAARAMHGSAVDFFIPFPLDFSGSVGRFLDRLQPDLFILVETDFWPNFLAQLGRRAIPALLVNGRVTAQSSRNYRRFKIFFRPLFSTFRYLAMQTAADGEQMVALGVPAAKVVALGNLKYDSLLYQGASEGAMATRTQFGLPENATLLVAGSTHEGEEEHLLAVFAELLPSTPDLVLAIAPRNVERGRQIAELARRHPFRVARRSGEVAIANCQVLIVDTLGELMPLYRLADLVFVGGSLVAAGGHNPLEPAHFGKPILFGPHMEDFAEISQALLAAGGAKTVGDRRELARALTALLADRQQRVAMGEAARRVVAAQQGVTERHLGLIREVLAS